MLLIGCTLFKDLLHIFKNLNYAFSIHVPLYFMGLLIFKFLSESSIEAKNSDCKI